MAYSHTELSRLQECVEGLVDISTVRSRVENGESVVLRGRSRDVLVGAGSLIKINTSIGCSNRKDLEQERRKINRLTSVGYRPDLMMDLSIVRTKKQPYVYIQEQFDGPVGTLPHYLCYRPRRGIDKRELLEEVERQAAAGVSWMTLHLTAGKELYELARRTRGTPVTARGGGIIIDDIYLRENGENALVTIFSEVLNMMRKHGIVLSLGTTFRPANTVDALDEVHRRELTAQRKFLVEARRQGVAVMLEAVGHMRLSTCHEFVDLVRRELPLGLPIMTLGPIPTDAAVGEDHIANAVGGAYLAMLGGTHILNSVTREEHTGQVPNENSILEGLRAARIAAHAVNLSNFAVLDSKSDASVAEARDRNYTCVVDGGLFSESARSRFSMGCSRCGNECPLIINERLGR